jgi:hypothetical protein
MAESGIEQNGVAEVVVGLIPASHDAQSLEAAIARIVEFTPPVRAVLVHPPYLVNGANPPQLGTQWRLVANPQLAQDPSSVAQSLGDSFRVIFETTQRLGARACAIVASDLSTVTSEWIPLLLQPIVEENFDLVAPCYARHPFEGLINRSIVYPLVRALYGKRVRNPLGPDFGISSTLVERLANTRTGRVHPVASLATEAATSGMKICQSHLGPRVYPSPDWGNLSSLLAQVLGALFLDVERHAPHWQRARESQPIPEFGHPMVVAGPEGAVDVTRLIESFQLGARNLPEVWGIILPPSTIVELRRLAKHDAAGFRMPDETWARIVYDFALAHRVRAINRDQMLRAMTPIYLGWVASYALELDNMPPEAVEERLEMLCLAFEHTKSYLVSRWRWPDRFNP